MFIETCIAPVNIALIKYCKYIIDWNLFKYNTKKSALKLSLFFYKSLMAAVCTWHFKP